MPTKYELFYWPGLQGRGEFIRLAFEDTGTPYVDVVRLPASQGGGVPALMKILNAKDIGVPPLGPPFLRAGKLILGQTAGILQYLGPRLGLVPTNETVRLHAHQLQLTIADFVVEIHDTHHPIGGAFYYEDQKPEAKRRSELFLRERLPKYLGYFERIAAHHASPRAFILGRDCSYVDLSLFQIVAGLRYAFPKTMTAYEPEIPRLVSIHDRVGARPGMAAYLASPRRLPFNEHGIFRHYPELEA